jgi:hypothetical protein
MNKMGEVINRRVLIRREDYGVKGWGVTGLRDYRITG